MKRENTKVRTELSHAKPRRARKGDWIQKPLASGLFLRVFAPSRDTLTIHSVGHGVLMACLAERITRADVEPLARTLVEWHGQLAPAGDTTCVFRDSAFVDDVAKTNLAAILEQHGIAHVRSL